MDKGSHTKGQKKIEQHKLNQVKKRLGKKKDERLERAREAHASATRESNTSSTPKDNDFDKILKDPEIKAALTDRDVLAAFPEISANPANFYKYQSNPKLTELLTKLSGKLSGTGSSPGYSDGFLGFGGGTATPSF